jgi:hypothetical protein
MAQFKLNVSVNKNPSKVGIKVQFTVPSTMGEDDKSMLTQKLQQKLNDGLKQYHMTAQLDTDVPYEDVIGFTIPISDIKLLIKNIFSNENNQEEI